MVNLPNILPINVVGTISGTTASGTPTNIFSLGTVQNVVIVNENPLEVDLAVGGGGASTLQEAYDNGDGVITTIAGKTVDLQGTGALTAVTGTFTEGLSVGTNTINITPNAIGIGTSSPTAELEVVGDIVSRGTSWTSRTNAVDISWRSVTYGNGLFVAVASTGSVNGVMTSPDGINWTSRTIPADNSWTSVIYGNGLFVAVAFSGVNNRVMTSPDGITWTIRTTPVDNIWAGVTYGNGIFVAVSFDGSGDRVMTSPDGITWTSRVSAANNSWRAVTYGNDLFVAVAETGSGNRVMTSPDGIIWTTQTSASNNDWLGVTYGNGLFVAVASTGTDDRIMTSPDGVNWTLLTSPVDNQWHGVTYGNGLFVAVSFTGSGNRVMTSSDGITWTIRSSASDNQWLGVTYGNGLFVAVAFTGSGNRVMTSGKTEINVISTDNILQGGRDIRGDLIVTEDLTISGTTNLFDVLSLAPKTNTEKDAISSPNAGWTIFNTTSGTVNTYDGANWRELAYV